MARTIAEAHEGRPRIDRTCGVYAMSGEFSTSSTR